MPSLPTCFPTPLLSPITPYCLNWKKFLNILWCPLSNPFLVTLISVCIFLSVLVVLQRLIFLKNRINNSHFTHLPTSLGILLYTFGILQHPSWCSPTLGESLFTLASPTFPMMFTTFIVPQHTLEENKCYLPCHHLVFPSVLPLSFIVNSHLSTFPHCLLWSLAFFLHWSNWNKILLNQNT